MPPPGTDRSEFLQRIPARELDEIHPDLANILAHLHPAEEAGPLDSEDQTTRARLLEFFLAYRTNGSMTDGALRYLLRMAQTRAGRTRLMKAIKRHALLDGWKVAPA